MKNKLLKSKSLIFSFLLILGSINAFSVNAPVTEATALQLLYSTSSGNYTIVAGTSGPALTSCTTSAVIKEGWFYFTGNANGNSVGITFTNAASVVTYIYLYSSATLNGSLSYISCTTCASGSGETASVEIATTPGTYYYVREVVITATGTPGG